MGSTLFVIGNGFDKYHELPTAYKDYRGYLEEENPQLIEAIEDFRFLEIPIDGNWTNLEEALSMDYESLIDEVLSYCYPNVAEDHPGWDDALIEIEEETRFIYDFTGECFLRWIASINTRDAEPDVVFPTDSLFVVFNYTNTLEDVYRVPRDRILHIHGSLPTSNEFFMMSSDHARVTPAYIPEDLDFPEVLQRRDTFNQGVVAEHIQFGCPTINPEMIRIELEKQYGNDDFYGASIAPCVTEIVNYSEAAAKNLHDNYPALKEFLSDKDINTICIFGHSYTGVDEPYYRDVLIPAFQNCKWVFVAHGENAEETARWFCQENAIPNWRTIESTKALDLSCIAEG